MAEGQQDPASAGMPLEDAAPTPDYVTGDVGARANIVEPPGPQPVQAGRPAPVGMPPGRGTRLEDVGSSSDIVGSQDQMERAETPLSAPHLDPQQILRIKRLQAEHQYRYQPTSLQPQEQRKFEADMLNSAWGQGFMSEFGMSKQQFVDMINKDPSYDYKGAWKQNLIPETAGAHWRDRAPDGKFLKSPDHPTAWMEYYQAVTGRDPEADGVDTQKYNQMLFGQVVHRGGAQQPAGARPSGAAMYAAVHQEAQRMGLSPEQLRQNPQAVVGLIRNVMKGQQGQGQTAFLGMGQKPAEAPKMRDGQPVGPDGYTQAEREYMAGPKSYTKPPGSDGGAAAPTPPPAPAPPAGPPGIGTRKRQQQQDLEDIQKGKDLKPRSSLGGVHRVAARPRHPDDEPGTVSA